MKRTDTRSRNLTEITDHVLWAGLGLTNYLSYLRFHDVESGYFLIVYCYYNTIDPLKDSIASH